MSSFISIFITVGVCLGIYAYIKKKYVAQIQQLEDIISNLNLDLLKHKTHAKDMDDKLFVKEKEVSSYKSRLDTMVDINKELNAKSKSEPVIVKSESVAPTESPKRGRKPGSKKPYYKKKSGGNPS
jgi:hypothetical protein